MTQWIAAYFLILGAFFMFLAGMGTFRFPDLYSRMHAATKAASFGISLMLIGFVIYYFSWYLLIESILIVGFVFLTAPIASHMIGRAGYLLKVPLYKETIADEMQELYSRSSQGPSPDLPED